MVDKKVVPENRPSAFVEAVSCIWPERHPEERRNQKQANIRKAACQAIWRF